MEERGLRMLSTNHICGEGYWVWLIPLSTGADLDRDRAPTRASIRGRRSNTLDGALDWIKRARAAARPSRSTAGATRSRTSSRSRTSPTAASRSFYGARPLVPGRRGGRRSSTRSTRRARTSSRCRTRSRTDLVTRELDGEDVTERAEAHNDLYLTAYRTHLTFYERPVRVLAQPGRDEREDRRQQHPLLGRATRCCSSTASAPTSTSWRASGRTSSGSGRSRGSSRRCTASGTRWSRASGAARWCPTAGFPAMFERARGPDRRLRRRRRWRRRSPSTPT